MTQVWQYTDDTNTVVITTWPDGVMESCLVTAPQYLASVAGGATTDPAASATPAQLATAALFAGLAITSTGTSALDATYAVDPAAQLNITAIYSGIGAGGGLPGGGSTITYPDITGTMHTFTSVNFVRFATAVRDYVYALLVIITNDAGELPAASTTIA